MAVLSRRGAPQTVFQYIEPNDIKAQATPAFGIRPGDSLQVIQYFYLPNIFRLRHAPAPLGIYRHQLVGGTGLVGAPFPTATEMLGRDAVQDFVHPRSSVVVQTTAASPGAPSTGYLAWYGFGKSEELYVDLRVGQSMRFPGMANVPLSTTQVVEVDLGVVAGPALWFSAESIGAAHDLALHLFGAGRPLAGGPGGHGDLRRVSPVLERVPRRPDGPLAGGFPRLLRADRLLARRALTGGGRGL